MSGKTIALFIVFVTMLFLAGYEAQAHTISFSLTPEIAVKKSSTATAKAQGGVAIDTRLTYDFSSSFFIQAAAGFRVFSPSGGGSDWIPYRGYTGWSFSTGAGYRFPAFYLFGKTEAVPGFTARVQASFMKYLYTELHYFYPGLEIEPSLRVFNLSDDRVHLQIGVPVAWNLQRDLDLFFTAGLSLQLLFSF